jgi:hypothetical protein
MESSPVLIFAGRLPIGPTMMAADEVPADEEPAAFTAAARALQ